MQNNENSPEKGENIENKENNFIKNAMESSYKNSNTFGNKKMKNKFCYVKVWTSALLFGLVAGGSFLGVTEMGEMILEKNKKEDIPNINSTLVKNSTKNNNPSTLSTIIENVMPAVVSVNIKEKVNLNNYYQFFFNQTDNQEQEIEGSGSGIILKQTETELLILTNSHVVSDADTLNITFIDGKNVEGTLKSMNKNSDLAIISIPISGLEETTLSQIKVATIGNSESTKVGDDVIAIGNALGYGQSVTKGIISAKNKTLANEDSTELSNLIQTDAAINPGNSGGALLNSNGEVIGVNVAKYASTEIEGIGFAIPITESTEIINNLLSQPTRNKIEENERGYLNISVEDIDKEFSEKYNIPQGVYIASTTKDGAADKAGLKQGDIITKINEKTITSYEDLQNELSYYKTNDEVQVTYQTSDKNQYKEKNTKVILQELPTTPVTNKKEEDIIQKDSN